MKEVVQRYAMERWYKSFLSNSAAGAIAALAFKPRKSYSGGGEDCVVEKMFQGRSPGFYVDVGCFHPFVASNTRALYKKGWRGINIDVDAYKIRVFDWCRRKDANLCVAISDVVGEADFYFHDGSSYGSMSSLVREEAERKASGLDRNVGSRKVATDTLDNIFKEHGVRHVDFLTVDVEGGEEKVLKTIDFSQVRIDLIGVEIHGTFDEILGGRVHDLLRRNGYQIVAWTPPTVFYRPVEQT